VPIDTEVKKNETILKSHRPGDGKSRGLSAAAGDYKLSCWAKVAQLCEPRA
jgi:hypothetical protein